VLIYAIQKPTRKKKYVRRDFAGLPTGLSGSQPVYLGTEVIERFSNSQVGVKRPGITFEKLELRSQNLWRNSRVFLFHIPAERFC
jgi:hypothetical protein